LCHAGGARRRGSSVTNKMTTFQIIEAKSRHCGQMARLLHGEGHAFTLNLGVVAAHQELRKCFDTSSFKRAWLIDGKIAVLGGAMGSLMAPDGYLWLAVSALARRYPVEFIKESRRQLRALTISRRELAATVVNVDNDQDRRDIRFATFMGFRISRDKIPVTGKPNGALTFRYYTRQAA
jgi:hypothetical protein